MFRLFPLSWTAAAEQRVAAMEALLGLEGGCSSPHCPRLASATRRPLAWLAFVLCWLAVRFHCNWFINIIGCIQEKWVVRGLASGSAGACVQKDCCPLPALPGDSICGSYPAALRSRALVSGAAGRSRAATALGASAPAGEAGAKPRVEGGCGLCAWRESTHG